jgi:hypothetical protein
MTDREKAVSESAKNVPYKLAMKKSKNGESLELIVV